MIRNIFGKQHRPRRTPHVIDAEGRSLGTVKVRLGGFVVVPLDRRGSTEGSSGGMAAAHAIAAKYGLRIEYR